MFLQDFCAFVFSISNDANECHWMGCNAVNGGLTVDGVLFIFAGFFFDGNHKLFRMIRKTWKVFKIQLPMFAVGFSFFEFF